MGPKDILFKTKGFILKRIGMSLVSHLIWIITTSVLFGIGFIFGSGPGFIMGVIGLIIGLNLRKAALKYFSYMIKAAHVAVITEAVRTDTIGTPTEQWTYGKFKVKNNFAQSNVYFAVDMLVSKAVRQISKTMDRLTATFTDMIPFLGMFINSFINTSLNYIDECCLGYTFMNSKEKNKFKSSADGVVLYFQNWKTLLKSSLKTTAIGMGLYMACFIGVFIISLIVARLISDTGVALFVAICVAIVIAGVIKTAFVDTYVLISMMKSYVECIKDQEPKVDLYDKFAKVSRSFRDLRSKAEVNDALVE